MKRTLMILGILAAALLIVVACSPKQPTQPAQPVPPMEYEPQVPAADTTADQDVIVVDQEVVEIEEITTDLDVNGLDNLDQELAELDNLEI